MGTYIVIYGRHGAGTTVPNYIRSQHDGYQKQHHHHHHQTNAPIYEQQVEIQPVAAYIAPSGSSGTKYSEGYSNANSLRSHQPTFSNYALSSESVGNYPSPIKYYQNALAPSPPFAGNFNGYSSNGNNMGASPYGGAMADWSEGQQNNQNGWGWMKERPVNFSAVGLLGLLALMGMIQHVMTDMDSSTPKPNSETSFVSGNSMGGRPKPKPPKQMGMTTTARPKPRLTKKRSIDPQFSLPQFLIRRLSKEILPSYNKISEGFEEGNNSMNENCSRFHAWKIFNILTTNFQVPEKLAFSSLSKSFKAMSQNYENVPESREFWRTWRSKQPQTNLNCF